MNATTAPVWGSIAETATRLGVSEKTVRRMIARGEVTAKRFGPRLIRVRLDLLEDAGTPLAWQAADAQGVA